MSKKSLHQKLWNMAAQDVSPNEASVAREKMGGGTNGYIKDGPFAGSVVVESRIFRSFAEYWRWETMRSEGQSCPYCGHSEYQHVADVCYTCGYECATRRAEMVRKHEVPQETKKVKGGTVKPEKYPVGEKGEEDFIPAAVRGDAIPEKKG